MATIPVGQTVVPIFPAGQQGSVVVYNSGPSLVYLGDSTGLNSANGYPVKVGSTVNWSANTRLYAVCDVGNTTSIVYSESVDGVFDASAVAGQILSQGLAGSIAQQIALKGVPLIDAPTSSGLVSQNYTTQQPSISVGSVYSAPALMSAPIDCSKYQTLFVQMWEARGSLTPLAPRNCILRWYDANGIPIDHEMISFYPFATTSTFQEWYATTAVLPVKGATFDITPIVNTYDASASPNATIRLRYSLSYRVQSKRIVYGSPLPNKDITPSTSSGYEDITVYNGMSTAQFNVGTLAAATNYQFVLPGCVGPALLTVGTASALATGQSLSFYLLDGLQGTIEIQRVTGPTSQATFVPMNIYIPSTPLILQVGMPAAPSVEVQWALISQNS